MKCLVLDVDRVIVLVDLLRLMGIINRTLLNLEIWKPNYMYMYTLR